MATTDLTFEKGLPANIDAERFVLGSVLLNQDVYFQVAGAVEPEDFSLEKHRRIFARMKDLYARGEKIDRLTIANELMKQGQLESVDGFSYLVTLDEGLPALSNLDSYIRIVKDKATLRRLIFSAQKVIDRCLIGEDEPDEILAGAEESLLKLGEARAGERLETAADVIAKFPGGVNAFLDPSQRVSGLSTGFTKFDEMTGGLHGGELLILAARPSMGKTALAINIAEHVALHEGLPVAVFSMEMGAAQLAVRIVGSIGRIDQSHLRTGKLSDEEWPRLTEAIEKLRNISLHIDESAGLTSSELRANARRLARQCGQLGLIVVDYLQLMSGAVSSDENRATELGEISRGLKMLAKELKCPVLALSQLNRSVETRPDKRPMMSDLRESGAIEQDADIIMFIYRDDYYTKEASKEPGIAEVLIAKQRNGPTGVIKLAFLKPITKFESLANGGGGDF